MFFIGPKKKIETKRGNSGIFWFFGANPTNFCYFFGTNSPIFLISQNWKKTLLDTFKRLNIPPSLQISCPYLLVCSNCQMKNHVQLLLVKCSRWLIHLVQYSLTQLAIWKDQQLAVSFLFSSQMKEPTRLVSQSTTLCQSQIMCNYKLCRGWYQVHYQPLLWSTCHNRFWLKNLRATWWLHFSPSEISMETMAQQVTVSKGGTQVQRSCL